MADIFLSYASVDVDRACRLAEVLQQYGSVFWDRTIPTGKTWRQHIGAELESGSDNQWNDAGSPRVIAHPRLPQIRTCPIRASGSSV